MARWHLLPRFVASLPALGLFVASVPAFAFALAFAFAFAFAGCSSDDVCGPGDAPAVGLVASSGDVILSYGNLTSGRNHDCTPPDAPAGVISLTLEGTQVGSVAPIVFCVPRPDLLDRGAAIGTDFRIIDVFGGADGCTFMLPLTAMPTGNARVTGYCDNGLNPAGYALTIDAEVELERTCSGVTDLVSFRIVGTTAVRSLD